MNHLESGGYICVCWCLWWGFPSWSLLERGVHSSSLVSSDLMVPTLFMFLDCWFVICVEYCLNECSLSDSLSVRHIWMLGQDPLVTLFNPHCRNWPWRDLPKYNLLNHVKELFQQLGSSLNVFPAVLQAIRVMVWVFTFVNEVVSSQLCFQFLHGLKSFVVENHFLEYNTLEEVQCLDSHAATGSVPKTEWEMTST